MDANPYLPLGARLAQVVIENEARDIKTFQLVFDDPVQRDAFVFLPGQFAELSLPGFGEAPFGIASSPTEADHLAFSVKRVGVFTSELHQAEEGRRVGVRGPLGKPFPWEEMRGKHLVIVGGGFAFTTLRSAIVYLLDPAHRGDFGEISVVYGARSPGELMYKQDLEAWAARDDLRLFVTVDRAEPGWQGHVGVVPAIVSQQAKPRPDDCTAIICGPPIMLKYTLPVFEQLGFPASRTILSLENRMKCGIGKCGRCNVGDRYVCKDGPVFSREELATLPAEY